MLIRRISQYEVSLKKFQKGKRIGKGAFGHVYQVQSIENNNFYAAKIIDCGDDETQCQRILDREVSIMMSVDHPTIIKLIGYSKHDFYDENNVTIIMDYMKNESLANVIKKIQNNDGPKDYTNTSRQIILAGVCRGMKYLHDRNIIHRDLKPGNILLYDAFHPYISDFGLSKIFEEGHLYSQSQFVGTLPYMAPEVLKNAKYGQKADVYSFAILMYEVVTDSFSYPELERGKLTDFEFRNKVINEEFRPKFTVDVKKPLMNLIKECWSNDPNQRPTFNEIFKKLSEIEKENDYFLDDVDVDYFKIYIEDITEIKDPIDKLLKKIETVENENNQLKVIIDKINVENQQIRSEADLFKEENQMIKAENNALKKEIYDLQREIQSLRAKSSSKTKQDILAQKDLQLADKNALDEIEKNNVSLTETKQPQEAVKIDTNIKKNKDSQKVAPKNTVSRNKLGEAIQAETNGDYDKAIDLYLSLKPEDCGGKDQLDQFLERAIKVALTYRQNRLQEVVNQTAQILVGDRRHLSLAKILENIEAYPDAFEIYKLGGMWEDAARLAHYLEPDEQEQFNKEYQEYIQMNKKSDL